MVLNSFDFIIATVLSESVSVNVPTCESKRESVSEIEQDSVRERGNVVKHAHGPFTLGE